jgi:GNAT superfamily N-acetyltransferase
MMAGQFEASWLPPGHIALIQALGADVGGELVGWIHVWGRDDDTAVLESLFVKRPHRHKGHARRLVEEAIDIAKRADYPMIEVHAMVREPEAIQVWERHLLCTPPNHSGHVVLLGRRLLAQGWRLPTTSISV